MAWLSFSSAKLPNVIVPRQISETTKPVLPSLRVFMGASSLHDRSRAQRAAGERSPLRLGQGGGVGEAGALVLRQLLPQLLVGEARIGEHARVGDADARAVARDRLGCAREVAHVAVARRLVADPDLEQG